MNQVLIVLGGLITLAISVWGYFRQKSADRKKIMKEAKKDLENAHKNKNPSDILDAWDKSGRAGM